MIGVVNVNPCVDKTLLLPTLPPGGIHTAASVELLAGGKGANVARVLRALGAPCRLLLPVAGENGALVRRLLRDEGADAVCHETSGMTRVITTIAAPPRGDAPEWPQLVVKEPGPILTEAEADAFFAAFLRWLDGVRLLAVCGAASCPALAPFAARAVAEAHRRRVPVLLDASGDTLAAGLSARPDYVKPNLDEAARFLARPIRTPAEEEAALGELPSACPLLTLGARGVLTLGDDGRPLRVLPPPVREVNAVGSGDSFVAALLAGLYARRPWRETLALAAAAGAANAAVFPAACLTRAEIEALVGGVTFLG